MGRSLLLLVSGLTIITGLIQVNNSKRVSEIPNLSHKLYNEEQARSISKSLIDNAIETIKNDNDWIGSIPVGDVIDTLALRGRSYNARKQYTLGNITLDDLKKFEVALQNSGDLGNKAYMKGILNIYTQNSSDIPNNSVTNWDEYKVLLKSTAIYDDTRVTTEVLMQRDSFSKYAYFSNSELCSKGQKTWFRDEDVLHGPVHTNGQFIMVGSPTFHGLVLSLIHI